MAADRTLCDALRQKLDLMPNPGDGPDYHAEIAFWKDSVRDLLTKPAALSLYAVGVGYTLATGKLYCDFAAFQKFASDLLGRPLMTHEFADKALWDELRATFEIEAEAEVSHAE